MKLVCIGELLIDLIPNKNNTYTKYAGGAPANVSVAAKLNGVESYFIGKVGNDFFGRFLIDELNNKGIDTKYIVKDNNYPTSLAIVSLTKNKERDFNFYRNPSADQYYYFQEVPKKILNNSILHFGSLSLANYPIKKTLLKTIKYVEKNNGLISFDPNIRLTLWKNENEYKNIIKKFIKYTNILKLTEEELLFLFNNLNKEAAINILFKNKKLKYLIITLGDKGVELYINNYYNMYYYPAFKINVKDTVGAGDAFIGAFLGELIKSKCNINNNNVYEILKICNATAALTLQKHGSINAIPKYSDVVNFIESYEKTKL